MSYQAMTAVTDRSDRRLRDPSSMEDVIENLLGPMRLNHTFG